MTGGCTGRDTGTGERRAGARAAEGKEALTAREAAEQTANMRTGGDDQPCTRRRRGLGQPGSGVGERSREAHGWCRDCRGQRVQSRGAEPVAQRQGRGAVGAPPGTGSTLPRSGRTVAAQVEWSHAAAPGWGRTAKGSRCGRRGGRGGRRRCGGAGAAGPRERGVSSRRGGASGRGVQEEAGLRDGRALGDLVLLRALRPVEGVGQQRRDGEAAAVDEGEEVEDEEELGPRAMGRSCFAAATSIRAAAERESCREVERRLGGGRPPPGGKDEPPGGRRLVLGLAAAVGWVTAVGGEGEKKPNPLIPCRNVKWMY
jgi:hypothetical protein